MKDNTFELPQTFKWQIMSLSRANDETHTWDAKVLKHTDAGVFVYCLPKQDECDFPHTALRYLQGIQDMHFSLGHLFKKPVKKPRANDGA